ncbi:unnamed protein product [Spirodela intermedia]|uniref:Uncharacterized protein n=1 Tax=Spirodela intermedia TaxID=51605 RepID=A0A7I8JQX0_SPIIN|nr:unnamed protein product [Spirodela intermedia]CAA6672175.1 unnamed protein product [Spirodela intermedia]
MPPVQETSLSLSLSLSLSPTSLPSLCFGRMGLEGVAEEEPMRSPSPAAAEVEMKKEEEGSETPRSSIYRPKSALTCPAAPRKPQARSKRKARPPQGFFPVPWDLGSVFFAISAPLEKRIRAG